MAKDCHQDDCSLRPLGLLEQYSTVRSQLGIYTNVAVTGTYTRPLNKSVRPAIIRAVATVIAQHPILSAVPVDTDTPAPYFLRLPEIKLDKAISFSNVVLDRGIEANPVLDSIIEEQHNRPFRHESPLQPFWRLLVLETAGTDTRLDLCFCFHHSLADTKSALVFLEDVEHALNQPSSGSPIHATVPACEVPLLPSMESLHEMPISGEFLARQKNPIEPGADVWSGAVQALPLRTRFRSFRLSAESTATLQTLARERGASLTSTLMAALAASFFQVLPPAITTIHGDCAVSLRRFLPSPVTARSMGCYVGSLNETYTRHSASSAVWSNAKQTKATIDGVLAKEGADMPQGFLRHTPDMAGWFRSKIGRRRMAAFELSNVGALGKVPRENTKSWTIEGLRFSQSASATAAAVKVSTATGRDGMLTVGFSWQEGLVEEKLMNELVCTVHKLLANDLPAA